MNPTPADRATKHTPGPWRWQLNETHRSVSLVGGRPQYDLTIVEPIRWGMSGATLHIRDTAVDGMNLMHKLHERRDWIAPFAGRAHHAKWCADIVHPDMRLMAAAPDLLEALQEVTLILDMVLGVSGGYPPDADGPAMKARAALAKATGAAA